MPPTPTAQLHLPPPIYYRPPNVATKYYSILNPMCRHYQPFGLCKHPLVSRFEYRPEDPRNCAKARLKSYYDYETSELAVRCTPIKVVEERLELICKEKKCWIDVMLKLPVGWLCCKCFSHGEPNTKECSDYGYCGHEACLECLPHSTTNYRC